MTIKQVKLKTGVLTAVYEFYAKTLGLPASLNANSVRIKAGESVLIFENTREENPFYHFAFNIPYHKTEEAAQWLAAKTSLLWLKEYHGYIADFKSWHARAFYFIDPAGNIVELIGRADLNDFTEETFSCSHFRNISEIGLVFDGNFDLRIQKLLVEYDLNYFSKQPPFPLFRAIGDDEGLFIAVSSGRNWLFTDTPSKVFPVSVDFLSNQKACRLQM